MRIELDDIGRNLADFLPCVKIAALITKFNSNNLKIVTSLIYFFMSNNVKRKSASYNQWIKFQKIILYCGPFHPT